MTEESKTFLEKYIDILCSLILIILICMKWLGGERVDNWIVGIFSYAMTYYVIYYIKNRKKLNRWTMANLVVAFVELIYISLKI